MIHSVNTLHLKFYLGETKDLGYMISKLPPSLKNACCLPGVRMRWNLTAQKTRGKARHEEQHSLCSIPLNRTLPLPKIPFPLAHLANVQWPAQPGSPPWSCPWPLCQHALSRTHIIIPSTGPPSPACMICDYLVMDLSPCLTPSIWVPYKQKPSIHLQALS